MTDSTRHRKEQPEVGEKTMRTETSQPSREYFVFREAANNEELVELLRLRYRFDRSSKSAKFVPENQYGLDLDCYDGWGKHFGLFLTTEYGEIPIGYMRITEGHPIPEQMARIIQIAAQCPELINDVVQEPKYPFPLMNNVWNGDVLLSRYQEMRLRGENLAEVSRLALDESAGSQLLARHMVECALAIYFFHYGVDQTMRFCETSKSVFYHLYGLDVISGTPADDFAGIGVGSCCMLGSATGVPDEVRPRLLDMAQAFRETGRICHFANNPNVFVETEAQVVGISTRVQERAVA
jgi:hypothetical protein